MQGLGANIMSLGGIAISIGVLVDAAIIMVENAHKHYEKMAGRRSHFEIILRSAKEVGPTLFFTLLVITVSFMPVFTLQAQEGRLFKPLAFTKTYAMGMASILAVTVVPVLMFWFVRGKIRSEERHPVSRVLALSLHPGPRPGAALALAGDRGMIVVLAVTLIPLERIGSEFMPPLWEGDLLYMPTTFPGLSITKAQGDPAADRQDHPHLSRSGVGVRQDRTSGDRYRPGTAVDDRDHHRPQGPERVAPRLDAR